MLYDTTADVIRKALRGLGLAPSQAAALCSLPERDVITASREPTSSTILALLAPALNLNPEALTALNTFTPSIQTIDSIVRLDLPFDDETVNAWLISNGSAAPLLFDTGDGANDVSSALKQLGIQTVDVLITHSHGDHTGGLRGLQGMIRSLAGPEEGEVLKPGNQIERGNLTLRVIGLPGHCAGALGYVIEGLEVPVCVTGDALFAGSIGGCAPGEPYRQALASLGAEVMTLPDETILLPGHGPASTVAQERRSNPFLAR